MQVIDNFLPQDQFDKLSEFILSNEFPWYYTSHVSYHPDEQKCNNTDAIETDGWYHMLYANDIGNNSMFYNQFIDFFEQLAIRFGYTQDDLIRARLGLKVPKVGYTEKNYNLPHIDYYEPHDNMIYYLNESDGDTRLFDQYYTGNEPEDFSVQSTVAPKANRLLLMDGFQYHTASNPLQVNRRIVLNVNLKCK